MNGENCVVRSFLTKYYLGWADVWHVWGRREIYTAFLWINLVEGNHLEDLAVDRRIILKSVLR